MIVFDVGRPGKNINAKTRRDKEKYFDDDRLMRFRLKFQMKLEINDKMSDE